MRLLGSDHLNTFHGGDMAIARGHLRLVKGVTEKVVEAVGG